MKVLSKTASLYYHVSLLQFCKIGTLAYEKVTSKIVKTDSSAPITGFMLHGLLGQGKNWRTFCGNLVDKLNSDSNRGPWEIYLLDLRNHGATSQLNGFHTPHNMYSAAQDIKTLVDRHLGGVNPKFMMGHSLGGKVCMEYVKQLSNGEIDGNPPEQVWILDSQPGVVDSESAGEVLHVLETLKNIQMPIPDRKWLSQHLSERGFSRGFVDWVGSSLMEDGSGSKKYKWAFSLSGAAAMFHSYRNCSYWAELESPPSDTVVHLVRAANSDRWTPEMLELLHQTANNSQGKLQVHLLENAGHWLHVDNPEGLQKIMYQNLNNM